MGGFLVAKCRACGWRGELDNEHRLASYICKQAKEVRQKEQAVLATKKPYGEDGETTASYKSEDEGKPAKKEKNNKKDKKNKKDMKENLSTKERMKDAGEIDKGDNKSEPAKEKKSKKEKKDRESHVKADTEGKHGKHDTGDKHAKKDMKKAARNSNPCSSAIENGSDGAEAAHELSYEDAVMTRVVSDITDFVAKTGDALKVEMMYEEVRAQQVTYDFDNKMRMFIVVSALFPNASLDSRGVQRHSELMTAFIKNGKLRFEEWIWGFEAYLASNPTATKKWAMVLKELYDADLAEEESILRYYSKDHDTPGFDISKTALQPFIKWLEMSSGSDDSDGAEEDSHEGS